MKKNMIKPEIEFIGFCTEDIITTSGLTVDQGEAGNTKGWADLSWNNMNPLQ